MNATCPAGLSSALLDALFADDGIGTEAAKRAAKRLVGKARFVATDVDDITQEIRIHICAVIPPQPKAGEYEDLRRMDR